MKLQNTAKPAGDLLEGDAEAAAYLRQQPRTIRDWRNRRALPHIKVTSKVILFRRSDLDAWLDRHAVTIAPVRVRTLPQGGAA